MIPDSYIDSDTTDPTVCLDLLVRSLDAAHALYFSLSYPTLNPYKFGYDVGKKYARVWYDNGTQRFVAFFVQMDNGDVWKAAGWKGPALNFTRGNAFSVEGRRALTFGKMNPQTGYFYPAF